MSKQLIKHPKHSNKIENVIIDPKILESIQKKTENNSKNNCPSMFYTKKELEAIGMLCVQNPSLYRKVLANLYNQRNPGCLKEAEEKFKYTVSKCDRVKNPKTEKGMKYITDYYNAFWKHTKDLFDKFYNENKNKKCTFEDYSLNEKRYKDYQSYIDTEIDYLGGDMRNPAIKFLKYYKYIQYIPFDEFYRQLVNSTKALKEYIRTLKNSTPVILRLAYNIDKSALWVTMLIYHLIKDEIDGVSFSGFGEDFDDYDYFYQLKKKFKQILIIYPDDCIYSGNQFGHLLTTDFEALEDIVEKIEFYSLSPYITTNFKNNKLGTLIPSRPVSINLGKHIEIKSISEYISIEELSDLYDSHELVPFKYYCSYKHGRKYTPTTNIYFQHKMADKMSVPAQVYLFGYAPYRYRNTRQIELGSLIKNCDSSKIKFISLDVEDESQRCPPSCYKKITYTFNGKALDKELNLTQLKKL